MTTQGAITTAQAIQVGLAHHQAGRIADAAVVYRQVLTVEPDNFDAINNLGNLAQAQGRLDEALRSFERAAQLSPEHTGVHHNLGLTRLRLGALSAAMQSFRDAWIRNPMLFEAAEQMVATAAALARTADRCLTMPKIANAPQPSLVSIVVCSIDDQKHARIVELYGRLYAGLPHEITVIRDAKS